MNIPRWSLVLALCGGCYAYNTSSDVGYGGATASDASATEPTTPGGEAEDDFLAMPPAQTDRYVFVANPDRDTLTRVDVRSLEVITTPVGADPRLTRTTADQQRVVVFNRADDAVSIVEVDTLDQTVVPVRDDLNQMVLSPDSRWAALWFDPNAVQPDDPPADGLQSFNEASFVDLGAARHHAMAVGFAPKDVVFTPDGRLAVVVSDASLAVVRLDADPLQPELIPLSSELVPPVAEEVVLAPGGDYAFVRQFGATEVLVIDLQSLEPFPVWIGANPTDLDLLPDGSAAVVVVRDAGELWILDTDDPLSPSRVVPLPAGSPYGSIAMRADGSQGLLYTTAAPVDRVALWDPATDAVEEHGLVKPVSTVGLAPQGSGALIFHPTINAADADPADPFFNAFAVTLVDLDDFRTSPLRLPSAPLGYAMAPDGSFACFAMVDQPFLELGDLSTLLPTQVGLRSNPVHLGVMPDDPTDGAPPLAWVSQDHDLGRISFYDPEAGSLETITGFELNAGIE